MGGRFIFLAIIILMGMGCSSSKQEAYTVTPLTNMTEEVQEGKALFYKHCNSCHPGGNAGLGAPIVTTPVPGFLIQFQIRNGLGTMPAFSEEEISDEEVDKIVDYLKALRK